MMGDECFGMSDSYRILAKTAHVCGSRGEKWWISLDNGGQQVSKAIKSLFANTLPRDGPSTSVGEGSLALAGVVREFKKQAEGLPTSVKRSKSRDMKGESARRRVIPHP